MRCSSRKHGFEWYQDALAYMDGKDSRNNKARLHGAVYLCPDCGQYHVTSKRFTLAKPKGRGKRRRGLVGIGR